jgi:hypothetical protein
MDMFVQLITFVMILGNRFKDRLRQDHPTLGCDQLEALVGSKATPLSTLKLLPRDEIISRGQDPLFFTHGPSAPDRTGAIEELIPTVTL